MASFAKNATFDGENILNGTSTTTLDFLANVGGTETISMNRQDMSLAGLNLDTTDFTAPATAFDLLSADNATSALNQVKLALDDANAKLAELGAQSKQIEKHNLFVGKLMDSLEVGIGNLVDADMAKESARLQALQVQQQLGAQALSIANQAPQIILSLFKG